MIYVGIDIAKFTHVAVIADSNGKTLVAPFSFQNDAQGFSSLLIHLETFPKDQILIGLESTAHYAENVISYLLKLEYQVALINPLQTAALRNSGIRKTKTDKVDSLLIVKALRLNHYIPLRMRDAEILSLRGLCKTRQNLIKLRTRSKIQLSSFVDQLFPELNAFFRSGLHINTSYQLLKLHSCPGDIAKLHLTSLSNLLLKASRGRYTKQDAIHLKNLAAHSVGIDSPVLSLQIELAIVQIELFNQQLDQIQAAIEQAMLRIDSPILTVPGIGFINGAIILSSIGDGSRFPNASKLLAFAGLDPAVRQSGQFSARNTRMSKRGSPLLRYALINAAHNVARNNTTFSDYYTSKVTQGKSHYNALGHVAHKLIRVLFTILTRNIVFNLP
ncbi:MAG: IS110 family transposase [Clostridiales bacterium]|nr:IS110 family transposase [Clostridiales bacterium]